MMKYTTLIASVVLIIYTYTIMVESYALDNEVGNFFTNASNNIPRIGRSGKTDFENFFLKASKSVPRIGRETENFDKMYFNWMKQNGLLPRYAKRDEANKDVTDELNREVMISQQALVELLESLTKNYDGGMENDRYKRDRNYN